MPRLAILDATRVLNHVMGRGISSTEIFIEEPRSKLRGMFCRAAVLRSDRKEFCLI